MTLEQREANRKKRLRKVFEQLDEIGHFKRCARACQFPKAKRNGGTRPIASFNWVDKARQHALKSALTPFANLHDSQFLLAHDPGRRGPAAARNALLAALNECGEDHIFIQFDIVNFYESISHDWLERNLRLHPAIVRNQIHTAGMRFYDKGHTQGVRVSHEATKERDRWGIPQGSSLSSLVAEQAMAAVLRSAAVFSELPSFTWSDNLGMIVPRSRVGEIESLVREVFASHEAGPFQLTATRHAVTSEFKFLGTWYRKGPNGAEAFIPEAVYTAWEGSIYGRLLLCEPGGLEEIERHVKGKLASWRWYAEISAVEHRLIDVIRTVRESHQLEAGTVEDHS